MEQRRRTNFARIRILVRYSELGSYCTDVLLLGKQFDFHRLFVCFVLCLFPQNGPEASTHNITAATDAMGTVVGKGSRTLGLQVFEGMPSPAQMLAVVNSQRPALFRGALYDMQANLSVWNRENFMKNYGHTKVTIADIPYRSTFSSMLNGTGDIKLRMSDYLESFGDGTYTKDGIPLYMFSAG